MHPELERLVNAAVADGVVTAKERVILYKKAAQTGMDIDELDMILDGHIHALQSKSNSGQRRPHDASSGKATSSPKHENTLVTLRCPSCTAPIKNLGTCPFCKAEIRTSNAPFDAPDNSPKPVSPLGRFDAALRAAGTIPSDSSVYVDNSIPEKKKRNALKAYGAGFEESGLRILYDGTVFGSAKEGIIISPDHIAFKEPFEPAQLLQMSSLTDVNIDTGMLNSKIFIATQTGQHQVEIICDAADYIYAFLSAYIK
jgi:hypothetical protein